MQWFDSTVSSLRPGRVYTHGALISQLRKDNPALSDNSYHWAISNMLKLGRIVKLGFDEYILPDGSDKPEYRPFYSDIAGELADKIDLRFPEVKFTIFETVLMNEFLNHLIAQNTIFIQVEKEISIFVFRYLQECGYQNLMYKPTKRDYNLYWVRDCIVVTDMISEAPLKAGKPHEICLEKMLVDMFCDKLISGTYSKAEYEDVMNQAHRQYRVEKAKLLRYARRRNKESEIQKYLMQNS